MSSSTEAMAVPTEVKSRAMRVIKTSDKRKPPKTCWVKTDKKSDDENYHALGDGNGRAAESSANHYFRARDRRDQSFLEKPELSVPNNFHSRENGVEKYAHGDDSGSDEIDVASSAGFCKNRTKTETQSQKKKYRLTDGANDARS